MSASAHTAAYTKDHPLLTRIVANRVLSGPESEKDTRHFAVDIAGSGLTYTTGDALGVYPTNRRLEVEEIIEHLGATGWEPVTLPRGTETMPLREALLNKMALAGPTRRVLEFFAQRANDLEERARLEVLLAPESPEQLVEFTAERHFVDLLHEHPSVRLAPQEFVDLLRRLTPRLYSIASSPRLFPNEVHLAVSVVRYTTNRRDRHGVCSTFLADRVELGETPVMVFVAESHFRLPEDTARDVIMIGPGVGIAPFRAFLQERAVTEATGRNWLFFGDQRRECDYLYSEELEAWRASGHLARLDLAFSRDQEERIYVQQRMLESAPELWRWLEGGAALYVCGDAKRMAKDVDAALHQIVAEQGAMPAEAAAEYVKRLKREKRYLRDVY
jgi:sulfite reductase (NADPH) flavoprotein alpha-component